MKILKFSLPFLFLASAPVGLALGGGWSFLTVALTPAILCGFDWALGFEPNPAGVPEGPLWRALPGLFILAQVAVTAWTAMVLISPGESLLAVTGATASLGVSAGVFGVLAAHELVHRREPREQALGLTLLALVGYMHFRIAHIHGHHVSAATVRDPTTARRGESAYRFIGRAVVGQVREAWRFEVARLRRRGERVFGLSNRMVRYGAIELAVAAAFAALGPVAFGFWLGQAALAIIMLELFNYIAHYGLLRRPGEDGALERLGPRHSWNSSRRMNNWSLFNMGRHSDHHRHPTRAYQALEAMEGSPELPAGYAGAILLALAPPLWRRVMDPRADAWMAAAGTP